MTTLDAAEIVPRYARAGLPVFPLRARGKFPIIPNAHRDGDPQRGKCHGECGREGHGVYDATTDLGVIAEWLGRYPGCNWGVHPPAGVLVLDVDPRNGGDATMAALEAKNGPLPSTLTARTGSGGTHAWFTYNGPSRGKLGTGVDIKKRGGYLVAPPSIHPCGEPYTWTNQSPAVPAPQWLRLMLAPRPSGPVNRGLQARGHGPLVRVILAAKEGERNNVLFWALCRATENALDHEPLIDAAVSIGLSRVEAEGASHSARTPRERTAAQ